MSSASTTRLPRRLRAERRGPRLHRRLRRTERVAVAIAEDVRHAQRRRVAAHTILVTQHHLRAHRESGARARLQKRLRERACGATGGIQPSSRNPACVVDSASARRAGASSPPAVDLAPRLENSFTREVSVPIG